MENKKTFGEYICRRRKELGLTQREFAQRLFVTESAVSKWERGLSYPDVTLLRSICEILEISEHELLTASEDTEGRRAELLAKKYLALTRNFRLAQYIFYGLVLAVCLIVNLAVDRCLSWFFIALAVVGACASLTLVPALVEEHRGAAAAGGFTLFVELTLLASCLYTGGDWFLVAGIGALLGLSVFLLPVALRALPLPPLWQNRKSLLYFLMELALLLLLLAVCALDARATWFPVAALGTIFGTTLVFLPFLMRQVPLPPLWQNRKTLLYFLTELALLLLLLAVCALDARATWFPVAALGTIFGTTLVFLPFLMRQVPLPEGWRCHKALAYFTLETALLLLLELACSFVSRTFWFFLPGLPITLYLAALPWAVMLLIRYAPIRGWYKASGCCTLLALYHAATPAVVERTLVLSGEEMGRPLTAFPWFTLHLTDWSTPWAVGNNVNALISLGLLVLAAAYLVIGATRRRG